MTTMGVYVRDLLLGQIVSNLERMKLPTKPSGATGDSVRHGSEDTAQRPPSVKATLSVSFGQRALHCALTGDSSTVHRTLPPALYERTCSNDAQRSPSIHRSQSRECSDKDRDRNRDMDRNLDQDHERDYDYGRRGRNRDCGHDCDKEKDWARDRDRNGDHDRDRDRDKLTERYRDRDRVRNGRSRYRDSRDSEDIRDDDRHYRERSHRSCSRSPSHSCSGNTQFDHRSSPREDGGKGKTSTSSNLAKLKDIYGDVSDQKEDTGELTSRRDNSSEKVIRLGGSTWR